MLVLGSRGSRWSSYDSAWRASFVNIHGFKEFVGNSFWFDYWNLEVVQDRISLLISDCLKRIGDFIPTDLWSCHV